MPIVSILSGRSEFSRPAPWRRRLITARNSLIRRQTVIIVAIDAGVAASAEASEIIATF